MPPRSKLRAFCAAAYLCLLAVPAAADPPNAELDARAAQRRAEQASRHVLSLLDRSRLDGDRRRAECFDGALTQIDSFARLIDERTQRLLEASARGDARAVDYHRSVIARLLAQLREREQNASSCFGPRRNEVIVVDRRT